MKNLRAILTDDVQFILATLNDAGHETRIVGGAVRNFLMGEPISDIDMATTAIPQRVMEVCTNAGMLVIPIGVEHGTVTVMREGKGYEITTLRRDTQTFGRKASVTFSDSFEEDSQRRDFSINALYLDSVGKLYDYHSGLADIEQRNIRFIGDPAQRIREDYLRILRYFRFLALYGYYRANEEYLNTIATLTPGMSMLSTARIMNELLKIFEISDSYKIILPMKNVFEQLFLLDKDPLTTCQELGIFGSMSPADKFCMLLLFSRSDVHSLVEKYHFPREIAKQILQSSNIGQIKIEHLDAAADLLVALQKKSKQITAKQRRNFYIQYSLVDLYLHRAITDIGMVKSLLHELQDFSNSGCADFKFRPHLLADLHLTPQQIKAVMAATRTFWSESDVNISEADCLIFAKNYALRVAQTMKC